MPTIVLDPPGSGMSDFSVGCRTLLQENMAGIATRILAHRHPQMGPIPAPSRYTRCHQNTSTSCGFPGPFRTSFQAKLALPGEGLTSPGLDSPCSWAAAGQTAPGPASSGRRGPSHSAGLPAPTQDYSNSCTGIWYSHVCAYRTGQIGLHWYRSTILESEEERASCCTKKQLLLPLC